VSHNHSHKLKVAGNFFGDLQQRFPAASGNEVWNWPCALAGKNGPRRGERNAQRLQTVPS
jgi:hypothetical protein